MKNFPHQINDLDKLTRALGVIAALVDHDEDVSDDQVLGHALTRKGIYTYRDKSLSVSKFLRAEAKKPKASRGSETAARDIRRFFTLTKLIEPSDDQSHFRLTDRGNALVASDNDDETAQLWRDAMLNLELPDEEENVSHPYRVLLRLIDEVPGIETNKLMLALEAKDDSDEEFDRIRRLADNDLDELRDAINVTEPNARNAVKILPSIARQLGDMESKAGGSHAKPKVIVTEEGIAPPGPPAKPEPTPVSVDEIGKEPVFGNGGEALVDLTAANEIRKGRTVAHQKAVKSLAKLLDENDYELYKHPFDCLASHDKYATLLIEVKTLDGTPSDERQQAALAVGQLSVYKYFSIPQELEDDEIISIAAFSHKPQQATIDFLEDCDIRVIWLEDGVWLIADGGDSSPFRPGEPGGG